MSRRFHGIVSGPRRNEVAVLVELRLVAVAVLVISTPVFAQSSATPVFVQASATPVFVQASATPVFVQASAPTREAEIIAAQEAKAGNLKPYEVSRVEAWLNNVEDVALSGRARWHTFFDSAYAGGGVTLGAGYLSRVSSYNTLDVRGSLTPSGYKRIEAEFRAPRLLNRRGSLSVVGGWRDATRVGFYGFGTANTSKDDRANYSFTQPYAQAVLDVRPIRQYVVLTGGLEMSHWDQGAGSGSAPSVEEVYSPDTLPGLGASPTYVHSHAAAALDWRTAPGYTRTGGYLAVTGNHFGDLDDQYSFRRVDYDVIQHIPVMRDTWVFSLRGRVETTLVDEGQAIPFFMLPALGGGSTLRGFSSWRFRDRHSLLVAAEWRVLVNRFLDTAVFYDAGKVTSRTSDLDFGDLKSDYGVGFRFHGRLVTPLRVELAKSNEGIVLVFSSHAPF
jgi:Omp85 superfamily domain